MFKIRKLEEGYMDLTHVLTVEIGPEESGFPGEGAVEHFPMTEEDISELYGEAVRAAGEDDVFENARMLETQVADLRRELDRERARATAIAGVATPAGTPVYMMSDGKFANFGPSPLRSFAELRREADDLRADRDRIKAEFDTMREIYREQDRKLRAILGIKVGDSMTEAVRSLVRSDDDSADEEEENGVKDGDANHMHVLLNETGANFAPGSTLFAKVRAVCDELRDMRSTWSGMDPVAVSKAIQDCDDLRRFRDAVGQMTGADNPRSIPSVLAALSRLVTAPQLEAKARIQSIEPTRTPASYAWTFARDDGKFTEKTIISAPTLKEARRKAEQAKNGWHHVPETKEERDRAYMESCDYPPRMVDPS